MATRNTQGQFVRGQSGNRKGRPKGSRNKSTVAALQVLEGESEALTRKVVELALDGDTSALRLCLERIVPVAKERPINSISLPAIDSPTMAVEHLAIVVEQLAAGQLLPSEANAITRSIDSYLHAWEKGALHEKLEALEGKVVMFSHQKSLP